MAKFELRVRDTEDDALEVTFNGKGFEDIGDMSTNTAAQNLAILLWQTLEKVDIDFKKALMQ